MAIGNGKDPDGMTLPEAVGPCEGSEVLQQQLAHLAALQDQHTARVAFEAQRQIAIAQHRAEIQQAEEDFIAARKSGDHAKEADAARRISRAEARLVLLRAYHDGA
jgi:hypothetical protein